VYSRIFAFKTGLNPEAAADHDIEPDLGLSAESPDAVTWTIKLRPDAKFHNVAPVNGHPLEAEDVKATFVRAIDSANPNRGSLDFIDPARIQAPDKSTVVFKLKYPYAPFRRTLASPTYSWIFPREALAGSYDPRKVAIGSGPFTFESYTPDVAGSYKKNPEYYVKGRPYVDGMKLAIIPDPSQQLAQFTGGNVDEIGATQSQSYSAFDVDPIQRANPKAQVVKSRYSIPNHIMFQLGDPKSPFLDIRVRQAFSMAIDRDVIGKSVWGGQYETIVHVPGYMGKWSMRIQDLDPKLQQQYKYNPAEAKKLLEAAGATNLQLKLTWANNFGTPQFTKAAETIGNFLSAVGVKNTLDVVDFNTVYIAGGKGLKNGFYPPETVLLIAQAPYNDADEFIYNFFDSKSTNGNEKLNDPALDSMIDKQRTIVNEDDRLKACLDIQRYLAEKMYGVSTVGTYNWAFVSPRVQNYQWTSGTGRPMETYSKLWLKG
ncbi:MAG TPA: ABC transporter substrate-binding protein, partial [Dehalococcoidia bacterium]|nr:ABC transporter substrate-binding protein [Dehalococcoidia bacterium]